MNQALFEKSQKNNSFEQKLISIFQDKTVCHHRVPAELIKEITTAMRDALGIIPIFDSKNPLSLREMLCLVLLASGKNPPRCADLLNISPTSVMTYELRIRKKLKARNRTQAFFLALRYGYFKLVTPISLD